jgi:hypothetical protein
MVDVRVIAISNLSWLIDALTAQLNALDSRMTVLNHHPQMPPHGVVGL